MLKNYPTLFVGSGVKWHAPLNIVFSFFYWRLVKSFLVLNKIIFTLITVCQASSMYIYIILLLSTLLSLIDIRCSCVALITKTRPTFKSWSKRGQWLPFKAFCHITVFWNKIYLPSRMLASVYSVGPKL